MPGWLKKLLVACPRCAEIAHRAGAPYSAAHRKYHARENHATSG